MKNRKASTNGDGEGRDLSALLQRLHALREAAIGAQQACLEAWRPHIHRPEFLPSAANMGAYIGLRRQDLRDIQMLLAALGLSSLGRSEGHVLANLDAVTHALEALAGNPVDAQDILQTTRSFDEAAAHLQAQTRLLLGPPPSQRVVCIMVTLPSEAATDYAFVRELVRRGMDCARINCAHDGPEAWQQMVAFVRQAAQEVGRPCQVMMDLAGPKLRTGSVVPDQPIVHLKVKRNNRGGIKEPAAVILDGNGMHGRSTGKDAQGNRYPARLSVDNAWLAQLKPGDHISFTDLRGRSRRLAIKQRLSAHEMQANCSAPAYLEQGIMLTHETAGETPIGPITASPMPILLREKDRLRLTRAMDAGEPGGQQPAHIPCVPPAVFDHLEPGQRVLIDDGKIEAVVEEVDAEGALLRINRAKPKGSKLGPEKGLNFPDTELHLPALTHKDRQDLAFIIAHADIVGYSFVQSGADMDLLIEALAGYGAEGIGVVAKIETRPAMEHLPEIIVRGAGSHPFGVMIARGDLAVEVGYEQLAEVQEEILWLCESAHVPVIWATQVLEGLVKQNMPSRAEVTDAAMAERAECIMLNKGPFILDAIAVLDRVISRMESHQLKKSARMRPLDW